MNACPVLVCICPDLCRVHPFARLSFCELIYLLTIVDATTLHLSVECNTIESHIGTDWLRERVVMLVSLGDDTFTIPKPMAHAVGHGAVLPVDVPTLVNLTTALL